MKDKTFPTVRISESDYDMVTEAAAKKKRTLSDWIRLCTVTASKKVVPPALRAR